ncbi:MAG: ABC transporter ATP-binding protein [Chloroflexota bacterium]|jgi:lipopolysaccharide transport system ATP-binding protein
MEPLIVFENISKQFAFALGKPQTFLESFINIFKRQPAQDQNLWAVRDLSFAVHKGECLGLIGRNGSGKSTALKLVARILRPSTGYMRIRGRVSALLELGAGFHQDLTGRENIYLNASVLGLSRDDVDSAFDSIVNFSELGEFIDMPVKHYSSGMYMRLGFSVAIHVRPDILIVDEILAVGDYAFQTKCIDRIYEMKRQGTTIIMVSHDLEMMRRLCTHLLWMEKGEMQAYGPTEEVAVAYRDYSQERVNQQMAPHTGHHFERWGSREVEITAVRFLNAAGEEQTLFRTGEALTIEMEYLAHQPLREPEFGLAIYHQNGAQVNGPNSRLAHLAIGTIEGQGTVRYHVERLLLLPARYEVTVAIHDSRLTHAYDYHKQAYQFRVTVGEGGETEGLVAIPARWQWQPADRTSLRTPVNTELQEPL